MNIKCSMCTNSYAFAVLYLHKGIKTVEFRLSTILTMSCKRNDM